MGYTHYWDTKEVTPDIWLKFKTKVKALLSADVSTVGNGYGDEGTFPILDDDMVCFNGVGDDSFETFRLNNNTSEFNFCKTAQRDYDDMVVGVLTLAFYELDVCVRSDGDADDWATGVQFLNDTLNTLYDIPSTIT